VAVLSNAESPNHLLMLNNIKTAAKSLGVRLLILDARGPEQFDAAFSAMAKDRVTALFVFGSCADMSDGQPTRRVADPCGAGSQQCNAYDPDCRHRL
jgi:DNA-binding LacI/PurR family transcriptional regulator